MLTEVRKFQQPSFHSTRSPPRLRRLLTASRCRRFHSRVSSPRATSQRARISSSSSVRVNLTLCTWSFCGKKNGSEESSALCCVVSTVADRTLRLDVVKGAGAATLEKAGSSMCRSMSRSSSESISRSR